MHAVPYMPQTATPILARDNPRHAVKKFEFEAPKSLTDIVAGRLREAIVDGEFQLGEAISEETLAQSFGVSRTPVRDALTLLQTTGLVEIRAKRGSFVFQPNEADIRAICDFRVVLEVHAARLSHGLDKAAMLAGLENVLADMLAADAADDSVRYGRADSAFHDALFTHCGNAYVRDAYRLLSGKVAALRTNLSRQFADARSVSLAEHRQMITLLERGDFASLEHLLQLHVGRTVDAFRLASEQRGTTAARRQP
jgi:DNA-binding GntR family transcriptional regulator